MHSHAVVHFGFVRIRSSLAQTEFTLPCVDENDLPVISLLCRCLGTHPSPLHPPHVCGYRRQTRSRSLIAHVEIAPRPQGAPSLEVLTKPSVFRGCFQSLGNTFKAHLNPLALPPRCTPGRCLVLLLGTAPPPSLPDPDQIPTLAFQLGLPFFRPSSTLFKVGPVYLILGTQDWSSLELNGSVVSGPQLISPDTAPAYHPIG